MATTKTRRMQRRQTKPGSGNVPPKMYDALTFGGVTFRLNLDPAKPRKRRKVRRKP